MIANYIIVNRLGTETAILYQDQELFPFLKEFFKNSIISAGKVFIDFHANMYDISRTVASVSLIRHKGSGLSFRPKKDRIVIMDTLNL